MTTAPLNPFQIWEFLTVWRTGPRSTPFVWNCVQGFVRGMRGKVRVLLSPPDASDLDPAAGLLDADGRAKSRVSHSLHAPRRYLTPSFPNFVAQVLLHDLQFHDISIDTSVDRSLVGGQRPTLALPVTVATLHATRVWAHKLVLDMVGVMGAISLTCSLLSHTVLLNWEWTAHEAHHGCGGHIGRWPPHCRTK